MKTHRTDRTDRTEISDNEARARARVGDDTGKSVRSVRSVRDGSERGGKSL